MAWQVTEVQRYLKGADYPMDGSQLAELARSNDAPDDLVQELSRIDRVEGPSGVMERLKGELGGSTSN